MNVDKVGPQGYRSLGVPPRSAAAHGRAAPGATPVESKDRTDTVEISTRAAATGAQEAEPIGLLPQLVVRVSTRLRTAVMDRRSAEKAAAPARPDSSPSRTEARPESRSATPNPSTTPSPSTPDASPSPGAE